MINKRVIKLILRESIRPVVALSLAIIVFVLTSAQITKMVEDIHDKRTVNAVSEQRLKAVDKLENDLMTVGADLKIELMNSFFPPTDNIEEFILWAENLVPGNAIPTYNFSDPQDSARGNGLGLSSINYNMNFSGNSSVLLGYLSEFETAPYFTSIMSVTINSAGGSGWENNATMNIQAELYTKDK